MTLDNWLANRWIERHQPSNQEIDEQMEAARRDLADAKQNISPSWRFAIAYNAALRICTAALNASGYRATRDQKHYRTIAALPLILGQTARELADFLDGCRTKRHDVTYESVGGVSDSEANELIDAVHELDRIVSDWFTSRDSSS